MYPLIIAQFELVGHKFRNEHWSLAALQTKRKAHMFQLLGNTDTFVYESSVDEAFSSSTTLYGGCLVGKVDPNQLEWVKTKLNEVVVVRNKPEEFDCQNWVMEALRLLKDANHPGVQITQASEMAIRDELMNERERWEIGEDTLEDRLFDI